MPEGAVDFPAEEAILRVEAAIILAAAVRPAAAAAMGGPCCNC